MPDIGSRLQGEQAMTTQAYLECFTGPRTVPKRFELVEFPARIGRQPDCTVQLNVARISRIHAEIRRDDNGFLQISDLGSTNGTFVNGRRIEASTPIVGGDVIHVGDQEMRLVEEQVIEAMASDEMTQIGLGTLPHEFPTMVREFNELLDKELVVGYRQLITDNQGTPFGHELLGRGSHPSLDAGPGKLFALARALDAEVRLSRLMRRKGFEAAERAAMTMPLFFNTHPTECRAPDQLIAELESLRTRHPSLNLVFEVHEAAVTDLGAMAEIGAALRALDIGLAYDDFGAGQARLLELVEVPPHFLKFDIALISGVGDPDSAKYRLLNTLNAMIRDMGVRTLAEGIENQATASACETIGIDLFQGFFFGRPEPIRPAGPGLSRGSTLGNL